MNTSFRRIKGDLWKMIGESGVNISAFADRRARGDILKKYFTSEEAIVSYVRETEQEHLDAAGASEPGQIK